MIHRKYFFDNIRTTVFGGKMTQSQVDGCNALLDYGDDHGYGDREIAYALATTFHETAATMQPIAEYGKGSGKPYGVPDPKTKQTYYGRGYVQLTWLENYQKQDTKLKLGGKLVMNADLALDPDIAVQVLFEGLHDGDFTGVKFATYFNDSTTDWLNARRMVNGTDKADLIASYAVHTADAIVHV